MLQSLLDSGVSETGPALIAAVIGGHQSCIDLLLDAGADAEEFKGKALVAAAELGTIDLVKQLLAAGANPRASEGGEAPSAFIHAVLRGDLEIIKVLLEAGANVSQRYQDQSALALAARQGHADVVEFLLEQGLDPLEVQKAGAMAAHFAAGEGHVDVLRCLAKHGSPLTAMKADGLTPAGMAALKGLGDMRLGWNRGRCFVQQREPKASLCVPSALDIVWLK